MVGETEVERERGGEREDEKGTYGERERGDEPESRAP